MKKKIAILFGGQSTEHKVSLVSATSVLKNIDTEKYEIVKIGITNEGKWLVYNGELDNIENGKWIKDEKNLISHGERILFNREVSVVFPVLHGLYGEDGTIQGVCKLAEIPCVGCDVLASAICMDKVYTKYVLENFNINQAPYVVVHRDEYEERENEILKEIEEKLSYPVFIKPANSGSSVGISKGKNKEDVKVGLLEAFKHDRKILVEKGINAREIEVSVLGNRKVIASVPGEVVPCKEFYDYEAKYEDASSELLIPARLSEKEMEEIKLLAVRIYKLLDCEGMARVDFLMDKDNGEVYLNEVNTLPGFTSISMYPKLWAASGIEYKELISKLIELAEEK
ncbi:D-alanine--D-alanine ligase family protein [Oceanirhabdus sp. W0125-5]|uniref:D-alanine--D-alanine ligase family protein n=1 Tax=Oceanirhabdus sp. W0125-5 TaxID=2999116 RepID=UPI0022F31F8B|nr:D-alanine--D-alanine ligase family protein [Oceanirhabdus sp. W0125-5]WBW98467.1 D-alanine--D-alanine ligase [Oceanirhabdus sp. W0125-5]